VAKATTHKDSLRRRKSARLRLDEFRLLGYDGALTRVKQNIVGIGNSAQEVEASTSLLKFFNVFDPNILVIRKFAENLVGGRHLF
jgi:hypothetical protein